MFFGLLNAFVMFKIGGINQISQVVDTVILYALNKHIGQCSPQHFKLTYWPLAIF
mgnify:CR=1 FL=1